MTTAPRAAQAVKGAAPRQASLHGEGVAQPNLQQRGQLQTAAGSLPPQERLYKQLQLSVQVDPKKLKVWLNRNLVDIKTGQI